MRSTAGRPRQVSATFGVSIAYIYKALTRLRLTGDSGPNPNLGHPVRKLALHQEMALAAYIRSPPENHARAGGGVAPGRARRVAQHRRDLKHAAAAWPVVHRKTLRAAEQDRPEVAARRTVWKAAQPFIDPHNLVFVDETGLKTKMARPYAGGLSASAAATACPSATGRR